MSMGSFNRKYDVSIIGSGVSGTSLALFARQIGCSVFVSDSNHIDEDTKNTYNEHGIDYEISHSEKIYRCDKIVVSSGIPPYASVLASALERGLPIVGELDFVAPYLNGKVVAITGSNGKTTTTALIGHILKKVGMNVAVAGNIGEPLSSIALKKWDYIVMELSSFQLHWSQNYQVDLALITNLAPDHIDWHGSYENYTRAKLSLIERVNDTGAIILQKKDFETLPLTKKRVYPLIWNELDNVLKNKIEIDEKRKAAELFTDEARSLLFYFQESSLLGKHNLENTAMAAAAVNILGYPHARYVGALETFDAPKHRCQLVLEHEGVRYVDDSKGTNVAACVTALKSLPGKKIVILGGKGKGEDYTPLSDALKEETRWAILMGEEKDSIARVLTLGGFEHFSLVNSMEEAVDRALDIILPGETLLLSPACTSWDAYANYKVRGEHFQRIVRDRVGTKE